MSAKRLPLGDDLPMPEWQRRRNLQVGGGAASEGLPPERATGRAAFDARQPGRGARTPGGAFEAVALAADAPTTMHGVVVTGRPQAPPPPAAQRVPLTGRPGTAAAVAKIVNAITGAPNTTASLTPTGVAGVVRRGAGDGISANAKVLGQDIEATGRLDPPSGRAEASVSGVRSKGLRLPGRIRIFTTPSGELDVELPDAVMMGPIKVRPPGTYVIGQPDAPKRKK